MHDVLYVFTCMPVFRVCPIENYSSLIISHHRLKVLMRKYNGPPSYDPLKGGIQSGPVKMSSVVKLKGKVYLTGPVREQQPVAYTEGACVAYRRLTGLV